MQLDNNVSRRDLIVAASASAIPAALAVNTAHAAEAESQADAILLTANGTGAAHVMPDMARISLSVQATASEATKATEQASTTAESVASALVAAGVESSSIQTSGVAVSPVQDMARSPYSSSMPAPAETEQQADPDYVARVGFSISAIAVDKIADVLSAAIEAGATSVEEVEYYASDEGEAYRSALTSAISDALASGQAMTQALSLGTPELIQVEETSAHNAYGSEARIVYDAAAMSGESLALPDVIATPTPIPLYASVTLKLKAQA